jgi:signal peptidase II
MTRVPSSRWICFFLVSAFGLGIDLFSKSWVFATLGYPMRTSDWSWTCGLLWGRFSIRLSTHFNQGALFGIGQGWGWMFALLSCVAAAGIVYFLFVRGEARSWWLTVTLAMILAGAMGNLYDRLYLHGCENAQGQPLYGVRDFLDCTIPMLRVEWPFRVSLVPEYHWPVFNLADSFLVTGAIMLTLGSLFSPRQPIAAAAQATQQKSEAGK